MTTVTSSLSSSTAAVLNPVNPSIATTSTAVRHVSSRSDSQVLNTCLERPSTMSNSRAGPVRSRTGVRSMMTVTNLSPRRVCRQTCSSTPITLTPSNRCGSAISTRRPSASTASLAVFHETPKCLSDSGDRQVLADQGGQRPPQAAAGQPGPWLGGRRHVLAPHMSAPLAAVAADRDQQDRRSPAERFVRQPPRRGVPRTTLLAAPPAPVVSVDDPAGQHSAVRFQELAGHAQGRARQGGRT